MSRYEKQLLLPEFTQEHQDLLKNTKLLTIGHRDVFARPSQT